MNKYMEYTKAIRHKVIDLSYGYVRASNYPIEPVKDFGYDQIWQYIQVPIRISSV